MASGFQSSFIPKEPMTDNVFAKKKTGFFGTIVVSLFVISILTAVGMVVYKKMIRNNIVSLQSELAEAEKNIDKKTIEEMSRFAVRLNMVKSIVFRHKVVSNFLDILSSDTVSSVRFSDFRYDSTLANGLLVSLKGKASSYGSVALQEDLFNKNKNFKSVVFSNLSLTDKGLVSFDLSITVNPEVAIYISEVLNIPSKDKSATSTSVNLNNIDNDDIDELSKEINNL